MNIVILSGKFGMGHWAAAQALGEQLRAQSADTKVTIWDMWEQSFSPESTKVIYRSFSLLMRYSPSIYNIFHRMTENFMPPSTFCAPFYPQLKRILRVTKPDLVISTHPVCANAVSYYRQRQRENTFDAVTCITDVTSHSEWLTPNTNCYLVPSEGARVGLIQKGVPASQICVSGIPVGHAFASQPRKPGGPKRRLLIMGGGLGLMPRDPRFYAALAALPDVETTVITGRNKRLAEYLSAEFPTLQVHGFIDNVAEHMAANDLLLSKPGGITVFEAISSGLPIAAWEPFLEQEQKNADFIASQGLGLITPHDTAPCLDAVLNLLYDEPRLANMRAGMTSLAQQYAENMEALFAPAGIS